MKIVAADIGGTNARFALAELREGERPALSRVHRYPAADHDGLASAWAAYARDLGEKPPKAAAIAVAAPADQKVLRFVNSEWVIDRAAAAAELGLERALWLNDFGAVAHAVSRLEPGELMHICGPEAALPEQGVATVLGPGTGLGVAMLMRRGGCRHVIETEGAHIGFAPVGEDEERIERALRARHGRASVERVVSGPGLFDIYRALGGRGFDDDVALWSAALTGTDPAAAEALDRLVKAFGTAAGDLALAHGANAVVISSGLSRRIADRLASSRFRDRFVAKGRYKARLEAIPVRLALHDEPGLLGAAIAFESEYSR